MDDLSALLSSPGAALFPGQDTWRSGARALALHDPALLLVATEPGEVPALLEAAERELAEGRWLAGYLAYEAGAAFGLPVHGPSRAAPPAWFACYPPDHVRPVLAEALRELTCLTDLPPVEVALNVTEAQYRAAIAQIKELLAAGDTYQVNYTCHARFALAVEPLAYFLSLIRSHPVPYAAYLNLGEAQVVSLSPELFLQRRGDRLESRPMKGTRPRGRTLEEDAAVRAELLASEKDRAENLMIVDMVRNDLGRVGAVGSIRAPRLFTAEKYRSVWQMTSTVTGRLPAGARLAEVLAATFPGASVTGAPKHRTMEIIRDLEPEPRGVYCGALGLLDPGGDFTLNLPIRTLVHRQGRWDLGIGAGIVWDSDPQAEYEETLLKASFAFHLLPELRLFETLLLEENRSYACLERHLARLAESAEYWGFPIDAARAAAELEQLAAQSEVPVAVRMELDQEGAVHFQPRPLPPPPDRPVSLLLSAQRTDSRDRFLYHKTTRRTLYDRERARAVARGFFEVIFCNERDHLTEGAITNLFVRTGQGWVTPPVGEGLLPGLWREAFLRETGAEERPITPEGLGQAEEIVVGNSVRGTIPVGGIWDEEGRCWWARA
jgi:para-aminobenzoate synthetase/4-amino-4-deoxychorismate lyase